MDVTKKLYHNRHPSNSQVTKRIQDNQDPHPCHPFKHRRFITQEYFQQRSLTSSHENRHQSPSKDTTSDVASFQDDPRGRHHSSTGSGLILLQACQKTMSSRQKERTASSRDSIPIASTTSLVRSAPKKETKQQRLSSTSSVRSFNQLSKFKCSSKFQQQGHHASPRSIGTPTDAANFNP
ncbi:hypothetical protein Nepgr_026613 [Nepenthes gracilis]|uniref:Uncharacterized protein n=1 Tax=Nepenthes gracilis TaxID=150966 RepID=A0AAD3T773_NEPGR|nr:hypothetical protein Nepgr_026613 [Nepenthes gracilis]